MAKGGGQTKRERQRDAAIKLIAARIKANEYRSEAAREIDRRMLEMYMNPGGNR